MPYLRQALIRCAPPSETAIQVLLIVILAQFLEHEIDYQRMDEHFPKIIRQWLGKQRDAHNESIDTTTKDAANICGASQAASEAAKGTEPISRKERAQYSATVRPLEESALQDWAQSKGLWISEQEFVERYANRQIGAGAEQRVYLHPNGYEVIKANTGTYHGNWLEGSVK